MSRHGRDIRFILGGIRDPTDEADRRAGQAQTYPCARVGIQGSSQTHPDRGVGQAVPVRGLAPDPIDPEERRSPGVLQESRRVGDSVVGQAGGDDSTEIGEGGGEGQGPSDPGRVEVDSRWAARFGFPRLCLPWRRGVRVGRRCELYRSGPEV